MLGLNEMAVVIAGSRFQKKSDVCHEAVRLVPDPRFDRMVALKTIDALVGLGYLTSKCGLVSITEVGSIELRSNPVAKYIVFK